MQPKDEHNAFLGVGWRFPVSTTDEGDLAMAAYEADIQQAIRIILGTTPGERVMRPDFGAGLKALVFEPVNTTTLTLVKDQVEKALIAWEPRSTCWTWTSEPSCPCATSCSSASITESVVPTRFTT